MPNHRERFREIIRVLGKYGFGHIYHKHVKKEHATQDPVSLRMAFEELGPSFIKIGQMLSTRNDLLPPEYITELKKLQDSTSPIPYEVIENLVQLQLEAPIDDLFKAFDQHPIASASVAQIHRATLKDGQAVIVKVQRPNIENELIRDLNIFIRVIEYIPTIFLGIIINPIEILNEIKQQTLQEIDFNQEASNALRFIDNNKQRTVLNAPLPYLPLTQNKVMVQDYVSGIPINQKERLIAEGYDLNDIAEKLIYAYLHHVFTDGFYHADPHPGNLLISDGKITFIDFGLMGVLNPVHRNLLIEGFKAIVFKDMDQLVQVILHLCKQNKPLDRVTLYRDLSQLFDQYLTKGFDGIELDAMFQDILKFGHKHGLTFPSEFIILEKAIVMIQGVIQELSPDLDFMAIFQQFLWSGHLIDWSEFVDPGHLIRATSRQGRTLLNLPKKLETTLDQINNDRLSVKISFENIENRIIDVNRMINRMISSLILAALIISSTFLVTNAQSQSVEILGIIFFSIGSFLALALLISIFKSSRY